MPRRFRCPQSLRSLPLHEQTFIITGVSKGLGRHLVTELLSQGATVIGLSRTRSGISHPRFTWYPVDLSNPENITQWCHLWLTEKIQLAGLINNAALIPISHTMNSCGWEVQWSVNYLAPWLLSHWLKPSLLNGRIIHISSSAHHSVFERPGTIHFQDIHFEKRDYDRWLAYAQSKLALLLHAKVWTEQHPNIPIVNVHPGWIDTTLSPSRVPTFIKPLLYPYLRSKGLCTLDEGCQAVLYTLLTPDVRRHNGKLSINMVFMRVSVNHR